MTWELTIFAVATNILLWTQGHGYQTPEACEQAAYQFVEPGQTWVSCSTARPHDCSDDTAGEARCIRHGFDIGNP